MKKMLFWGKEKIKMEYGDVLVGKDIKSKKSVKWDRNSRRGHMLLLGPTGCGKIGLTLLPLINQDMKNKDIGMTIMEPTGDLAEQAYKLALKNNRKVLYFNPYDPDCPQFNPLTGEETEAEEHMSIIYKQMDMNSPQFFKDMNEVLIRNAVKVIKRLYKEKATLLDLFNLVHNSNGMGRKMVQMLMRTEAPSTEIKENEFLGEWFLFEYFNDRSKTYEHCSGFRAFISKIVSNSSAEKIFTPNLEKKTIDFENHLEEGNVLIISTAHGLLRDVGLFLGLSLMLKFQEATFRLNGIESIKRVHALYLNESQCYVNKGFPSFLSHGGRCGIMTHIAAQNRRSLGQNIDGTDQEKNDYAEIISTNIRNVILYPGSYEDFLYYSERWNSWSNKKSKEMSNMFAYNFGEAQYALVLKEKYVRGIAKFSFVEADK